MVYETALQQTIDQAISPPFGTPRFMPAPDIFRNDLSVLPEGCRKCPPVLGPLALLHTNRELRSESADELLRLSFAHVRVMKARARPLLSTPEDCARIRKSRFSRLPLFKSVQERWDDVKTEICHIFQDLMVAKEIYRLVCLVKHGLYRPLIPVRDWDYAMWKIENLVLNAEGYPSRDDWAGDVVSRPYEAGMMHRVAISSHIVINEYDDFLDEKNNTLVAVERHDADWRNNSKGVGEHFLYLKTRFVSRSRYSHVRTLYPLALRTLDKTAG